ncbi:hypothetical protein OROMI_010573 [Orobanche minor]
MMKLLIVLSIVGLLISCHPQSAAAQDDENLPCTRPGATTTSCVRLLARGARIFCCDGVDGVDFTCLCSATGDLAGITSPRTLIAMAGSCSVPLPEVCSKVPLEVDGREEDLNWL